MPRGEYRHKLLFSKALTELRAVCTSANALIQPQRFKDLRPLAIEKVLYELLIAA